MSVAAAALGNEACRVRGDGSGARIDVLSEPDQREVHLAGRAVVTPVELAVEHESGPHSGPDGEKHEVVHTARDALPVLAECGKVDIVLEGHRQIEAITEGAAERDALEPRDAGREVDLPSLRVDDSGDTDDDAVDQVVGKACSLHQAEAERGDHIEHVLGVAAHHFDVLSRAGLAPQIADRAAEEARAEIEAEHERSLGHRLEEDSPVARPVRSLGRLADQTGIEQGEDRERDGRLRDPDHARDLGPRDGRRRADRLEHGPLIEVLEQWGNRSVSRHW